MYLHLPRLPPLHSPSKKPPSPSNSNALALLFQTFEGELLSHLKSLAPLPSELGGWPAVSFSYLSRAAGVLSSIHAVAGALISDPSLSGSEEAALTSYINSSIKLLDVCNALSAEIERLQHGRLLLLFVVHLLSTAGVPPPPEKIRKARESIREWEVSSPRRGRIGTSTAGLIRDMKPRSPPPSGKVTALGRAIYAVESVSALVGGALVSFLGGESDLAAGPKAPPEFAWADAFNELREALSSEIGRSSPGEMEAVASSLRKLAQVIDDPVDDGEKTERLRSAVKELDSATGELTDGSDRLRGAVNDIFRAVLSTRNTAVQSFRPGLKKCK